MDHYKFVMEFANELITEYSIDEEKAHNLAEKIDRIVIEETEKAVNFVVEEVSKEISETCELLNKYIEEKQKKK